MQPLGDVRDGADVGGDVLADAAVAAGGGAGEAAVFVGEVDGEAVDLQLAQEVVAGGADLLGDALGPGGEFLVVEGVVEGEHPLAVLDGGELRLVLPGDLLGGRVGGAQRRVLLLQFGEGAQLPVELGVADDGLVVDVVAEAVLLDLFGEVLVALPRVRGNVCVLLFAGHCPVLPFRHSGFSASEFAARTQWARAARA